MSEYRASTAIAQGSEVIEEALWERLDSIKGEIGEVIEPFVSGLTVGNNPDFDVLARHMIIGIDRQKADRGRALQVATRTFAVSQLVLCYTFDHVPVFANADVINAYIDPVLATEHNFIHMGTALSAAFDQSTCFRAMMQECQPSIDPLVDEPEVFKLFGGFALQSAAIGEVTRIRSEIESAAQEFAQFKGDVWELFDA